MLMTLICSDKTVYDPALTARIVARFGISEVTACALLRRGYTTVEQIDAFLHPETQTFSDPLLLPDIARAAAGLRAALRQGERICVYGDYDADGVCATALLFRFLSRSTDNLCYYVPSRHTEGYGLNQDAIRRLHADGVRCIVTVDNGISAVREAVLCRELGIRLLITDHHQCHNALPDADAVACSTRDGYDRCVNAPCGTGVAFLLARALGLADTDTFLPLVALATVADVMPLTRENRVFVARGLPLVKSHVGLAALMDAACAEDTVTAYTLSYILAPRLNAAGRMGSAMRAAELLLCDDPVRARRLAAELDEENTRRRAEEQRIFDEAQQMLTGMDLSSRASVVLCGKDWNAGVIGIVASRLSDLLYRPVILFTPMNGVLSGSGRSVPGVDLFRLLCACASLLVQFGGHAQAAGASVRAEDLAIFTSAFERAAAAEIAGQPPERQTCYEQRIELDQCTVALSDELALLAPFGEGNQEPVFLLGGIKCRNVQVMGRDGKHLSAAVGAGDGLRLVAFGRGGQSDVFRHARLDLAVCLRKNVFRGTVRCNAYLEDFAVSGEQWEKNGGKEKIGDAFFRAIRYNKMYGSWDESSQAVFLTLHDDISALDLTERELRMRYLGVRQHIGGGAERTTLWQQLSSREAAALMIFIELTFFRWDAESDTVFPAEARRTPLGNSILFAGAEAVPAGQKEETSWT